MAHGNLLAGMLHWILSALSLMVTAYLVRGFEVKNFWAALVSALVIGVANVLIWPILIFLTLPVNILTLGLFTFVVNGALLKISAAIVPGFQIKTWGAAILGSIVLSLTGTAVHYLFV